jgi:hypothetical protein
MRLRIITASAQWTGLSPKRLDRTASGGSPARSGNRHKCSSRSASWVPFTKRATDYDVSVPGCPCEVVVIAVTHPLHGCRLRAYAVRHVDGVPHLKVELPTGCRAWWPWRRPMRSARS